MPTMVAGMGKVRDLLPWALCKLQAADTAAAATAATAAVAAVAVSLW